MRLATDARLSRATDDGVGRYSAELAAAMRRIDPALHEIHDRHSLSGRSKTRAERWLRWLSIRRRGAPMRLRMRDGGMLVGRDVFRRMNVYFDRFGTPMRLVAPGVAPGIVHWSYPMPIRLDGWHNIYTVHDTVPIDHPALTPIDGPRHARMFDAVFAGAAAITTVSDAVRADVLRVTGLPGSMVSAVGQSVTPPLRDALPAGLVRDGYFLFCGRESARKNVDRIVAGWRAAGSARDLVLVGPGQGATREGGLVRLPAQSPGVIAALQADARALLFPTLAEGFGRPIVEAMALGTPVLTTRGHAAEEVAGGAALLVDPLDIDAISAAIVRLDRDDGLVARLAGLGDRRARDFGGAGFAERLATLYRSLIVKSGSPS